MKNRTHMVAFSAPIATLSRCRSSFLQVMRRKGIHHSSRVAVFRLHSSHMNLNSSQRSTQSRSSADVNNPDEKNTSSREKIYTKGALSTVGSMKSIIQWYPGHIAKAERALKDCIKLVDIVIEVRDCRIPLATAHPDVPKWVGNKRRVLAMNRADLAPEVARSDWRQYLLKQGEQLRFVNAKQGRGVRELKKLALEASQAINQKRKTRGLLPRPVRCLVMGYPNVGKSALINRLVGRRSAKSANKPGVTRNFQWVKISDSIELLDMPGIIPAKLVSQETALRLAICDDIGQAAYDKQVTAALMIDELKRVNSTYPGYFGLEKIIDRFRIDPRSVTGEEFIYQAGMTLGNGDAERVSVRLLTEFRSGLLGPVALESPRMVTSPIADSSPPQDFSA